MLETSLISSGVWREVNDLPVQRLSRTGEFCFFWLRVQNREKTTK